MLTSALKRAFKCPVWWSPPSSLLEPSCLNLQLNLVTLPIQTGIISNQLKFMLKREYRAFLKNFQLLLQLSPTLRILQSSKLRRTATEI